MYNISCNGLTMKVNNDFELQKKDIVDACAKNHSLTVIDALEMLRSKNLSSSTNKQKHPLKYEQVKKIIRDFREENNVDSTITISDPLLLKTLDGAIFRKCYNQCDILYKNKLVTNSYAVYCSPFQQMLLSNENHWYVDSTFHVVPTNFYQLLVIVVDEEVTDSYMPACYALASKKNTQLYYHIFRDLKEFVLEDNYELESMTLDFERAEKEGARKAFPRIEFVGCKFHFLQALIRKGKKKGIMNNNLEKEAHRIIYGVIETLENNVVSLRTHLDQLELKYNIEYDDPNKNKEEKDNIKKFKEFVVYIKNNWLEKYDDGMLDYANKNKTEWTNNAVESYHCRLQKKLTKIQQCNNLLLSYKVKKNILVISLLRICVMGFKIVKDQKNPKGN